MAEGGPQSTTSAADLHMHTVHSDGCATPRQILARVASLQHPQFVAITDHDTLDGAYEAAALAPQYDVACIIGEEITSTGGHILGLFLSDLVPPGLSPAETINAIHSQQGIAVAPHPFYRLRRLPDVPDRPAMESVGELVGVLPFDAIEVINATPFLGKANRIAQQFNREKSRLTELASSDAHILDAVGKGYTLFRGETAQDLRRAILSGDTVPQAHRYTAAELMTYLHYWLRISAARGGPAW